MNTVQNIFDDRLDNSMLNDLYEGDLTHAMVVFEHFSKASPEMMKEIELSYNRTEVSGLSQKVHKMKPVFSFVGLSHLTTLAESLEKRCDEIESTGEVASFFTQLQSEYSIGLSVIKAELKRLEGQTN